MTDQASMSQHQTRLYGIAYRMLGSKADAEDMVQEAYLRWHRVDVTQVERPQAWLVATVTRLCIDRLRKARTERTAYTGPWLPEPLVGAAAPPADLRSEVTSDLSMAFLVLLERLAPEERAAFLLHEVFDTEYAEIARILSKNEAACRQIVRRARERVQRDRPRFRVSDAARTAQLESFLAALHAEDQQALLALFTPDSTWTSDGGGKVRAARKVVCGAELISRFALGVWRRSWSRLTHRVTIINGEAGLVTYRDQQPISVLAIDTDGTHIAAVFAVLNPDKLKAVSPMTA